MSTPQTADEVAVIETSQGRLVLEFWPDVAPKTVENFKKLASQGFYDGTAFHRIVRGFMVQGGDPLTKDAAMEARWGTGDPGYKIKAEFNAKSHQRGVISMARAANPDSAGCQFFICLGDASFLDASTRRSENWCRAMMSSGSSVMCRPGWRVVGNGVVRWNVST